jgi:hypothetical protein
VVKNQPLQTGELYSRIDLLYFAHSSIKSITFAQAAIDFAEIACKQSKQ